MSDFDDAFDAFRRWLEAEEIAELERHAKLPSHPAATLETLSTNAVLLDGLGRRREMSVPDFRPEYLIPIPQPLSIIFQRDDDPISMIRPPIAIFKLSSIVDGKAVYRFSGIRT